MQYLELSNSQITTTTKVCPVCGTLLRLLSPTGSAEDFKEFYICPNESCLFVGSRDIDQLPVLLEMLKVKNIKITDFTVNTITGYSPTKIYFTENCFGFTPTTWSWNFGDGNSGTSTTKLTSHTYSNTGYYTVSMKVSDATQTYEVVKENIIHIMDYISPQANFSVDNVSGYDSLLINFTDLFTGSELTSWEWDFGDGSAKVYLQNPQHQYTTIGIFTVTLNVYNSRQQSNTITKTDLITLQHSTPTGTLTGDILTGYDPMVVNFTCNSTSYITSYLWDFGDGETANTRNPSHTYQTPGTYTVKLQLTNESGTITIQNDNYITVTAYSGPPQSNFTYSRISDLDHKPISVNFTDQSVGCGIKSYYWVFGDGYTSIQKNPVHNYLNPGVYETSLLVTDWRDATSLYIVDVNIDLISPSASFSYDTTSNMIVQFNNTSLGDYLTYYWEFKDGTTSTEENPSHQFLDTSSYLVTLQVTNIKGSDSTSILVTPQE